MNEIELNTLFDIVSDPVNNVYKIDSARKMDDILNIVKIFNITKSQKSSCKIISARGLVAFKMLVSNN